LALKALHQTILLFISWQKIPFCTLAPMEAASFYSGFQNKRYSVQQEKILAKIRHSFALKKY
jgi:hypothetical protein